MADKTAIAKMLATQPPPPPPPQSRLARIMAGADAQPQPQTTQPSFLGRLAQDPSLGFIGALEAYGKRSKRMREEALATLDQSADPNIDPFQGAGLKALGTAELLAHPFMAIMPSSQELRERGRQAGASPEMQAFGGMLGDMVNIPDPAASATALATIGKGVLGVKGLAAAAAPILGKSAAVAPLGKGIAELMADVAPAANGITAYHGSPHTFDKFDMSKIGTGEGAQAYGHGLYFAENEAVAKSYKGAGPHASRELDIINGKLSNLAREMEAAAIPGTWRKWRDPEKGQALADEYDRLMASRKDLGATYQVRLNVQPHELLDWDKPLSEQSDLVQSGISQLRKDNGFDFVYSQNKNKVDFPTNAWDGKKFSKAGIKGIRYKDAGSRDGAGGTNNYVIFDEKLIDILKRYGIPMTAGAGGAMMVAGQHMPPDIANQLGHQS